MSVYKNRSRDKGNINSDYIRATQTGVNEINASKLSASNLIPNFPIKTDGSNVLQSTKLSISDTFGLQEAIDNAGGIQYNGTTPAPIGNFVKISDIDGNVENSSITESDITTLQTDVGTLQTDVGNLQTDVGNLQTDVGNLQTDVGTLQTDVGTLQTDVGTLQTDVCNLQTDKLNRDGTQNMLGTLDMNNNSITNCNNLQTQSIKATDNVSVNFDNNIELQGNEIKSTKAVDFFFNGDIANIGVGAGNLEISGNNCALNIYSGLNKSTNLGINQGNNSILLNHNTNTVDLNSLDINLNGNNIIGLELINGIQPSGGLYSESSGFTILAANTVETNLLGQGSFSGSLLVPSGGFKALSMYSFKASGKLSGGANDTFTLKALSLTGIPSVVELGTIVVQLTDNGLIDKWWSINIDFTIRAVGGLGVAFVVLSGDFRYTNNNDVVKTVGRLFTNNSTFSTETSNELVLEYKNDITNPLTSFTIEQSSFTKWY